MRWDDAHVVILELLCTPAQQRVLLDDVAAALRAIDDKRPIEPGRWTTVGVRLRRPRSPDENAHLHESLAQPDDPLADEREAMVLEVGGRGSRRSADETAQVLCRALCPEEFHPGPCPIPWAEMNWALRNASRDEKRFYRDLFPRGGLDRRRIVRGLEIILSVLIAGRRERPRSDRGGRPAATN